MEVRQDRFTPGNGWATPAPLDDAQLVLAFGPRELFESGEVGRVTAERHPNAFVLGCSSAGEILDTRISDDDLVTTAIRFDRCSLETAVTSIDEAGSSAACGAALAAQLPHEDLTHVLVLSAGLNVNGSELIEGIVAGLPEGVSVTGGLSGDGPRFEKTLVVAGDRCGDRLVAAVGIYGDALQVGYGSLGGWDPFGPHRIVTRSEGNVVYELDGKPALQLYRSYLGEHAQDLPAAGLLFPLTIELEGADRPVVRTLLAVDEDEGSLTFAGDVPTGMRARLMKATIDRLVDGAASAAESASSGQTPGSSELALLISCVGRKLVMKQRVEEEVEAVREVLGDNPAIAGFYSYGEISPFSRDARCELHNQTMTITTLGEAA